MWITTRAVYDIETWQLIEADYEWYEGPVALCDRAAQQQAKTAAATAGGTAATEQQMGMGIESQLTPQLERWMSSDNLYDPYQVNQLLTAAGAGAGGATGSTLSQAQLEATRSRNPAALTATMDALARGQQQSLAKASEGIQAESTRGAVQRQQMAAQGLSELGQADMSDALKAMGLQTQDINAEVEAGKSGWFQNMTNLLSTLGNTAKGAAGLGLQLPGGGGGGVGA